MKFTITLIFVSLFNMTFAQQKTFSVDWSNFDQSISKDSPDKNSFRSSLNLEYDDVKRQFYFKNHWEAQSAIKDIEIFDVKLVNATSSVLKLINKDGIKENYEYSSGQTYARDISYNYIELNPVIKKGESFQLVKSFTILLTISLFM